MENYSPRIEVERDGEVIVVGLLDEEILEESVISDIAEALFSVVGDHGGCALLLSFAKVKHLGSGALGTLIRLNKRVEESGGMLKLCHIRPAIYEIFVITKLNKLFEIYETREIALNSLRG